MNDSRGKSSEPPSPRDPDPAELEIDEANDESGGPTTASLNAGLSSNLQPAGAEAGSGRGRSSTGGNVKKG